MDDRIEEAVDKAIANLNVDDLNVTKDQIDEIKKRLANNQEFIKSLEKEEEFKNGKSDRRYRKWAIEILLS